MTLPNADDPRGGTPMNTDDELREQIYEKVYYGLTMAEADYYTDWIMSILHKSNLQRAIDELENINNLDVPATYEQDGKTWQGLAIPRNLTKKRLAELQAELQQAEKE